MEEDYLKHLSKVGPFEIEELVNKYWRDIWNYTYVMTKKHELTEDITQETFIQAFLSLHSFRREGSVKSWLIKVARNKIINHKRSAFFRKIIPVDKVVSLQSSPSAEASYFSAQLEDRIWEFVLRLPPNQREVLLLSAHYRLKMEDIANVLELPVGTVKSRLNRARTKVEEWLMTE